MESTTSGTATASCYQSARNVQPVRDYRPENLQKRLVNTEMTNFHASLAGGYATADCQVTDGLLLAVSGGADSIALLHGTLALWPDAAQQLVVAHVNHRLRGADSDADADFVAKLADQLGLPCEMMTAEQGSIQHSSRGSLEAAARSIRYEFLMETASRLKFPAVVTAHHFDDQAETILHNIIRGTGLRGLAGMQSSRPLQEGITLVRPMLEIRSIDVHEYLNSFDAGYRTDSSNNEVRFTRNRIRTELLPSLRADFNVAVDDHIVSLGRHAKDAVRMLDGFAEQVLQDVLLEQTTEICTIDRTKLMRWPEDVRCYSIALLWVRQDWPRKKMTSRHYQLLATVVSDTVSRQGDLPGGVRFQTSNQILRLTRNS